MNEFVLNLKDIRDNVFMETSRRARITSPQLKVSKEELTLGSSSSTRELMAKAKGGVYDYIVDKTAVVDNKAYLAIGIVIDTDSIKSKIVDTLKSEGLSIGTNVKSEISCDFYSMFRNEIFDDVCMFTEKFSKVQQDETSKLFENYMIDFVDTSENSNTKNDGYVLYCNLLDEAIGRLSPAIIKCIDNGKLKLNIDDLTERVFTKSVRTFLLNSVLSGFYRLCGITSQQERHEVIASSSLKDVASMVEGLQRGSSIVGYYIDKEVSVLYDLMYPLMSYLPFKTLEKKDSSITFILETKELSITMQAASSLYELINSFIYIGACGGILELNGMTTGKTQVEERMIILDKISTNVDACIKSVDLFMKFCEDACGELATRISSYMLGEYSFNSSLETATYQIDVNNDLSSIGRQMLQYIEFYILSSWYRKIGDNSEAEFYYSSVEKKLSGIRMNIKPLFTRTYLEGNF